MLGLSCVTVAFEHSSAQIQYHLELPASACDLCSLPGGAASHAYRAGALRRLMLLRRRPHALLALSDIMSRPLQKKKSRRPKT